MPRTLRISGELDFLRVENIFSTSRILMEYIKLRLMHCIELAELLCSGWGYHGTTACGGALVSPEWR